MPAMVASQSALQPKPYKQHSSGRRRFNWKRPGLGHAPGWSCLGGFLDLARPKLRQSQSRQRESNSLGRGVNATCLSDCSPSKAHYAGKPSRLQAPFGMSFRPVAFQATQWQEQDVAIPVSSTQIPEVSDKPGLSVFASKAWPAAPLPAPSQDGTQATSSRQRPFGASVDFGKTIHLSAQQFVGLSS